jgi:acetyl-CoA carboxylase biotin carboxyl carrier protein
MATVMMTGSGMVHALLQTAPRHANMSARRNPSFREMKTPRKMPKRRPARPATAAKAPPAAREPTYDDILAIARLIESGSRFSEFRLRSGDIEVEVKRANGAAVVPAPDNGARGQAQAGTQSPAPQAAPASSEPAANSGNWAPASAGATAGDEIIRSPMVGTFYRSPEPGAPPFVEPGSRVEPSTIVCIIEVMKLMNSVVAGVSGVVTHVFVANAQLVEHGQPLIAIRPE